MIEPDLQYSILCDEVRREDNGKLIFLGVFEDIYVRQFPAHHRSLCVVNKWIRGEGSWTQQTRFVDENDNVLAQIEDIHLNLTNLDATHTSFQSFGGLLLAAPGKIWIEISLNNELKQRYPINVYTAPGNSGQF